MPSTAALNEYLSFDPIFQRPVSFRRTVSLNILSLLSKVQRTVHAQGRMINHQFEFLFSFVSNKFSSPLPNFISNYLKNYGFTFLKISLSFSL
jgi:hypothetical protein